jgi:ubiquinone/menaquinone biosynthesis C-methylase UbiE
MCSLLRVQTREFSSHYIPALRYHWLTRWYDVIIRLTLPEERLRQTLVDVLDPQPNDAILELGFGTGRNLERLCSTGIPLRLFGVEVDSDVYHIAAQRLGVFDPSPLLQLFDGQALPYADAAFDRVFSLQVFHHLRRHQKITALRELRRVLKPGGRMVLADWGRPDNALMRLGYVGVQLVDGFATTADHAKGLLPDFIREAGFSDVQEVQRINTLLGTFCYYSGRA